PSSSRPCPFRDGRGASVCEALRPGQVRGELVVVDLPTRVFGTVHQDDGEAVAVLEGELPVPGQVHVHHLHGRARRRAQRGDLIVDADAAPAALACQQGHRVHHASIVPDRYGPALGWGATT